MCLLAGLACSSLGSYSVTNCRAGVDGIVRRRRNSTTFVVLEGTSALPVMLISKV